MDGLSVRRHPLAMNGTKIRITVRGESLVTRFRVVVFGLLVFRGNGFALRNLIASERAPLE
jgi:hypothetical protein